MACSFGVEAEYGNRTGGADGEAMLASVAGRLLLQGNEGTLFTHGNDSWQTVAYTLTAFCACLMINFEIKHLKLLIF